MRCTPRVLSLNTQYSAVSTHAGIARISRYAAYAHPPSLPSLQVKTLMGALPETKETKPVFRPVEEYDDVEVPVTFDARSAWPKCKSIAHIRDQSTCGSCWAFGGVEAMSDRVCIASNETVTDELSAEDVLSCCGFTCGDGCNGGYPSSAWHFFMKHGLTTEAKYPYAFPPCEHHINASHYKPCGPSQPTPKCSKAAIKGPKYHGKSVYSVLPTSIEKEIMQNGPVEAAFTVYQGLKLVWSALMVTLK